MPVAHGRPVAVIEGEPAVDDFDHLEASLSQVKGAGLFFAAMAGIAVHPDLHFLCIA